MRLLLALLALACGQPAAGATMNCRASYYGAESGTRTASGARFDYHAMTAAHRSLPFGTRLRVSYRGRSAVVTVNDRGPFKAGRCLDLSSGAAQAIGLTAAGVDTIAIERLN